MKQHTRKLAAPLTWLICVALMAGACTTSLQVSKVASDPVNGQVYYLPRVEHAITLERELTECKTDALELRWLREEANNLERLSVRLRDLALVGVHPACVTLRAELRQSAGDLTTDISNQTGPVSGDPCKASKEQIEAAFEPVRAFWLERIQSDPGLPPRLEAAIGSQKDIPALVAAVRGLGDAEVSLKLATRATVTPYFLSDVSRAYAIDYQLIRDQFKRTEFSVEKYPNGTLKSINVTLEDQSGAAITSTIKGLTRLAAATGGFSLPAAVAPAGQELHPPRSFAAWKADEARAQEPPADLCKQEILLLLDQSKKLRSEVERLAKEARTASEAVTVAEAAVEKVRVELNAAKKRLESLPEGHPDRTALVENIGKLAAQVVALEGVVTAARKTQAGHEKAVNQAEADCARVRSRLTERETIHFATDTGSEEVPIGGAQKAVESWFNPAILKDVCEKNQLPCGEVTVGQLETNLPIVLHAHAAAFLGRSNQGTSPAGAEPTDNGIVYREPATGLLLVCREQPCLDANKKIAVDPDKVIFSEVVTYPQLGVIASLPLVNKAFQNNNLTASFAESGSLTKLQYTSNARGVEAAKTFSESADLLLELAQAKRGADAEKLETAKNEVDAEKALLEAQLARAKAQEALDDFLAGGSADTGEDEDKESDEDGNNGN